jgi:hypothetical protein
MIVVWSYQRLHASRFRSGWLNLLVNNGTGNTVSSITLQGVVQINSRAKLYVQNLHIYKQASKLSFILQHWASSQVLLQQFTGYMQTWLFISTSTILKFARQKINNMWYSDTSKF